MTNSNNRTAIIYDFDGTLSSGYMQNHSLIPELNISVDDFWHIVKDKTKLHDADEISIYMWEILQRARDLSISITTDKLRTHGSNITLFSGLDSWFDRINDYAAARRLSLEHYIISSGLHEMISGCSIFDKFKMVYASRFIYDTSDNAVWPAVAINYTTKTQFLFRINKGIHNTWDNKSINTWIPLEERPIPFSRIIFIGDGDTDIPSMKMVRYQGGHSIAVFDPDEWKRPSHVERIYQLIAEDRVHFVAPADYQAGSQLDVVIMGILGRIARNTGYRPQAE